MASQQTLKPQFFVTRQNGAMVPLIAMDELPIHVQIKGVARSLTAFEIAGMTGVGTVDSRHQYYVVESMNNTKPILPFKPTDTVKSSSATRIPILPTTVLTAPAESKLSNVDVDQTPDTSSVSGLSSDVSTDEAVKTSRTTSPDTTPAATAIARAPVTTSIAPLAWRNNTAPLPAANGSANAAPDLTNPPAELEPEMPPPGQKVYCSYWLRNGECNFAQQGCMYKHMMPINLKVLEVLGFRDLPDWYRKTYQCGSLRVNGGRNGLSYGIVDGNVGMAGKAEPRARVDAEASRRAIAAHINGMSFGRGARAGGNKQVRGSNPRPVVLGSPRIPAVLTEADKTKEKERRDQRLAAAFEADLESNVGTDMMDDEMEKIREREQAGWEEEQDAARKAAAPVEAGKEKKAQASETVSSGKTEKSSAGAEGKKKTRGSYGRRKKVQKE